MGTWHHDELRNGLAQKGWTIIAEHPGDEVRVSGSWEIQRSTRQPSLFIDFEGLDDGLRCLPMPRSYACVVRGYPGHSLYFRKKRSRSRWQEDLQDFLAGLDRLDAERREAASRMAKRWRCDWLYQRVFGMVEDLWERLQRESHLDRSSDPPESLRIEEWSAADWSAAEAAGIICRVWTYDARGPVLQRREAGKQPYRTGARHGSFWQYGLVRFHIPADRRRVLFEFQVGPLYGRGWIFRVVGLGRSGQIEIDRDAPSWSS